MALSPELLKILCCPETHQPLRLLEPAEIERINLRVAERALSQQDGAVVKEPLQAGLLREDGTRVYPVKNDIPILLVEEGIVLDGLAESRAVPIE